MCSKICSLVSNKCQRQTKPMFSFTVYSGLHFQAHVFFLLYSKAHILEGQPDFKSGLWWEELGLELAPYSVGSLQTLFLKLFLSLLFFLTFLFTVLLRSSADLVLCSFVFARFLLNRMWHSIMQPFNSWGTSVGVAKVPCVYNRLSFYIFVAIVVVMKTKVRHISLRFLQSHL